MQPLPLSSLQSRPALFNMVATSRVATEYLKNDWWKLTQAVSTKYTSGSVDPDGPQDRDTHKVNETRTNQMSRSVRSRGVLYECPVIGWLWQEFMSTQMAANRCVLKCKLITGVCMSLVGLCWSEEQTSILNSKRPVGQCNPKPYFFPRKSLRSREGWDLTETT